MDDAVTGGIEVRGERVGLRFPGQVAPLLDNLSFVLEPGTCTLLCGPSGSGKTSLLLLLLGMQRPTEGALLLDGQDITGWPERRMAVFRRRNIGVVFQRLHVLEHLRVWENLLLAGGASPEPSKSAIEAALREVDLWPLAQRPTWQLSTGEQQRLAIARALITEPRLVLADEPTSSLDDAQAERVLELLLRAQRRGATLFVATHDQRVVQHVPRVWRLQQGRLA